MIINKKAPRGEISLGLFYIHPSGFSCALAYFYKFSYNYRYCVFETMHGT